MDPHYRLRTLVRNAFNLNLLLQRDCDGYLVTAKHSGTHWLKHMLTLAMAEHYGLPRPAFADGPSSDIIIAHPRHRRRYPGVPRIVSSHAIPPYAFDGLFARDLLLFPSYVVLVRDIRHVLISVYEKWKHIYGIGFPEFVRGDRGGKRFACDVWWCMHFFNRWGEVIERAPGRILLIRYEDMTANPACTLANVAQHFGLDIPEKTLAAAVQESGKETMARRHDPGMPVRSVRLSGAAAPRYSERDVAWLQDCMRIHLRHALGYDFERGWEEVSGGVSPDAMTGMGTEVSRAPAGA